MEFGVTTVGHDKNTAIEHCRDAVGLGTAGIRCHVTCRDAAGPSSEGIFSCWALQEYSAIAVGNCRDTALLLSSAGILCG